MRKETMPVVDIETGELIEVSVFQNGLLYGKYAVVSKKTVREKESFLRRWKNRIKDVPGEEMVKTNRGYFIDGWNVDEKSTELWFTLTKNDRQWRPKTKTKWKSPNKAQK